MRCAIRGDDTFLSSPVFSLSRGRGSPIFFFRKIFDLSPQRVFVLPIHEAEVTKVGRARTRASRFISICISFYALGAPYGLHRGSAVPLSRSSASV